MDFWCVTPCTQVDGYRQFEDKILLTLTKIQGVTIQKTMKHCT
jgi:hypothetical protein